MGRLHGKKALVTAAGQGIGRRTAAAFASEGASVTATDLNQEGLDELHKECPEVTTMLLDVTDQSSVARASEQIGPVDVLFNCAGFVHHGSILDCTEEDWDFSFNINVKGMYRVIKAFIPGMIENGGGSIINMSSVVSSVKGAPNRFVYGATKAAVVGLTRGIAADFVDRGIRCNTICPGTVQTPSLDDRIAAQGDPDTARTSFIARQPMGRLGDPNEIASLAVYLASDEATFTTGTVHVIDGGWSN